MTGNNTFGLTALERQAAEQARRDLLAARSANQQAPEQTAPLDTAQATRRGLPLRLLGGAVDVLRTSGQLGSLFTAKALRNLGVGGERDRAALDRSISQALTGDSLLGKINSLKTVQEERARLWWGEKFFTEVLVDPLNLIGFGVLGKIPLAGKVLGPMEHAYINAVGKATALPGRGFGKLASKLPQPTVFATSKVRLDSFNTVKQAFESLTERGSIKTLSDPSESRTFLDTVVKSTPDQWRENPLIKQTLELLRDDVVLESKLKDIAALKGKALSQENLTRMTSLSRQAGERRLRRTELRELRSLRREAKVTNTLADSEMEVLDDMISAVSNVGIDIEIAVGKVVQSLGLNQADEAARLVVRDAIDASLRTQTALVNRLSTETPEVMARAIAKKASDNAGRRIQQGIAERRLHQGVLGAILSDVADPLYNAVWRNGIEKFAARPLAEAVLGFANFGPMNLFENMTMVLTGGAKLGRLSADDYADLMRGLPVPDVALLSSSRRATLEASPQLGVLGIRQNDVHLPGFAEPKGFEEGVTTGQKVGHYANSFLARVRSFGADWSVDLKRSFHIQRLEKRADEVFREVAQRQDLGEASGPLVNLLSVIENAPRELPSDVSAALVRRVKLAVGTGKLDNIRKLADAFTADKILSKQVNGQLAKLDQLSPLMRDTLMRVRRVDEIDTALAAVRTQAEDALTKSPEWARFYMDTWLDGMKANPPANSIELAAAYKSLNARINDMASVATAMTKAYHAQRVQILERGETLQAVSKATFDDLHKRLAEFRAVFNTQVKEGLTELRTAAQKVGVDAQALDTYVNLTNAKRAAWDEWWTMVDAERTAFFATGGRAKDWVVYQNELFTDFFPKIEKADKAWAAQADDMANVMRGDVPLAEFTAGREAAIQKYLQPLEGSVYDPRFDNYWTKLNTQLTQAGNDLRGAIVQAPLQDEASQFLLKTYLDDVTGAVTAGRKPLQDALSPAQKEILTRANDDVNKAFVNYNNQNTFDFVAKHIYPFWAYESRVWERLFRLGIQIPKSLAVFGPEGAYWDGTDNGYMDFGRLPIQASPIRGTMIGRLRRAYQRDFPEYEQGVYSDILKFNDSLERYGFYPGLHLTFPAGFVGQTVFEDRVPQFGAWLPPSYQTGVDLLMAGGAAANVPGIERIQKTLASDRFKDRAINMRLFAQGIVPSAATPDQRRDAIAYVSLLSALEAQASLTRYRPEEFDTYRQTRDEIDALIAGISPQEMKRLREAGMHIRETVPLSPFQREERRKALGTDAILNAYGQISRPLQPKAEQEKAIQLERFYAQYDVLRDSQKAEQLENDALLESGRIDGREWRDRRKEAAILRSGVWEHAKGMAGITDEDLATVFPLHPVDQAMQEMFAVDIDTFRDDVGDTDWEGFYAAQESVLARYDEATRGEVKEWLAHDDTDIEKAYKQGLELGFGDYDSYDAALTWYEARGGSGGAARGILSRTEASRKEQTRLRATGASRTQILLAGRVPGSNILDTIREMFRRDLLRTHPEAREWLRRYRSKNL